MKNTDNTFSNSIDTKRFLLKNKSIEMINFEDEPNNKISTKNNFLSFHSPNSSKSFDDGGEKDIPENPFLIEKNMFWEIENSRKKQAVEYTFTDLEETLLDKFNIIHNNFFELNGSQIETKQEVVLKVKYHMEKLESSVLYEGEINHDLEIVLNKYGEKRLFYHIFPTPKVSTKNYNEMIIDKILKKYKPKILDDDAGEQIEEVVDQNLIEAREFFHKNSTHAYFLNEMKELDRLVSSLIAKSQFLVSKNNKNEEKLKMSMAAVDDNYFKELEALNPENSLIKLMVFKIFKYQVDLKFVLWKINLLNLISKWKYEKDYLPVSKQKMDIKYLKVKFMILKLVRNKQKGILSNRMTLSSLLNLTDEDRAKDFFDINDFNLLPIFTYLEYDGYMIMFDIIIDIQVFYFMITCPMIVVLQLENSSSLNFFSLMFNGIYFFNLLRKFRRLNSDNTGSPKKNIGRLFWNVAKDIKIILGILSLIPYVSFYANITNGVVSEQYYLLLLAPAIRIIDFGKSVEFLEKTKYAMRIRLILLIFRFIIFAHWIGLMFYRYIPFDYYASFYSLETSCLTIYFGLNSMTNQCAYIIGLMYGTYLIPGSYFNGLNYINVFTGTSSNYFLLFLIYFIGQIIVAYVFGGVTDLIKNLNQASNIYREKTDSIKSFMIGYDFDKSFQEKVTNYYTYLKDKKRNLLYGKDLLSNISDTLKVKLNEEILPYSRYILKDFYGISKEKEKKFIASIITNFKECVAYPGEKIYTQGEVIKGLFIIGDGTLFFTDDTTKSKQGQYDDPSDEQEPSNKRFDFNNKFTVDRKSCMQKILLNQQFNIKDPILDYKTETSFPWDGLFLKTGRAIETCYVDNFTDLYLLETKYFDSKLIVDFPDEMNILQQKAKKQGLLKIGQNQRIKDLVLKHSARSVEAYYEESFNLNNVWIEIQEKNHVAGKKELVSEVEDPSFGLLELNFKSKINVV